MLVVRYKAAKEAIISFLADDSRNTRILHAAEAEQAEKERSAEAPRDRDEARLCIEALRAFHGASNTSELTKNRFTKPEKKIPPLMIKQVSVKVSLNLFVHATIRDVSKIGGLVLQTSKTVTASSIRHEHGRNVATLIWLLINEHMSHLGEADKKLCIALDVFGQTVTIPPNAYKRKINDFEAACAEIHALWNVISPPPSYHGGEVA